MRISRNFTAEDWKALSFRNEADWGKAIDIFLDRLQTRYMEHIDALLERETSGFVVLALDCAIVETLQQFRTGKRQTPSGEGGSYFRAFLTSGTFKDHFDDKQATLFYRTIRCGLLHQSEANENSRVKRGSDRPVVALTEDEKGIIINAPRFHALLKVAIDSYALELRTANSPSRDAFRRKMNYICRVESKEEGVVALAADKASP
jgi:hypothetical protein